MTENEAKDLIYDLNMNLAENGEEEYCKALDKAIKSLKKHIPKKPCIYTECLVVCPDCEFVVLSKDNYCVRCGQRLDWSDWSDDK